MRIGIFTEVYSPYISGVVTSVMMLKKSLEELGNTVYIVTINMERHKYEYDSENHILKVPGINLGIYENFKISSIYPIRLYKKIKNWNLDIIHTHTEGSMGTYGRILAKQFKIPVVHTYHTMYEDYSYLITRGHFEKPFKKILKKWTLFYCDKTVSELIVPTKKTYDLFKEKYNLERAINIIPTGIDTDKFSPENYSKEMLKKIKTNLGISDDDFVLLLVSRISEEQKNIKFLIDAHEKLSTSNKNIKLLIVGDGPDLNFFRNHSKDNKNIIYTGMVPQHEVGVYYQLGDIFVTSSKTETQGLTVIEAMASKMPVVCIDDESFKIIVDNDLNGLIFRDEDEYIKNVLKLYKDKNKYNIMSEQAYNSAGQFSKKIYGQRVLEVYDRAIKNKKEGKK